MNFLSKFGSFMLAVENVGFGDWRTKGVSSFWLTRDYYKHLSEIFIFPGVDIK